MISNKIKREKGRKERENEREREREREREKERKNIKKDNIVRFGRWNPKHGYTNNLKREEIHLHI
jgi:hypothetical protein